MNLTKMLFNSKLKSINQNFRNYLEVQREQNVARRDVSDRRYINIHCGYLKIL
jgi:hypothetical protein